MDAFAVCEDRMSSVIGNGGDLGTCPDVGAQFFCGAQEDLSELMILEKLVGMMV